MTSPLPQVSASPQTSALLQVRDLHAGYGRTPIVRGLSFSIQQGEVVSLLGRNGMGKTTLLRSLMGLATVTNGQIDLAAHTITHQRTSRICKLGMTLVPEGRGIFGSLRVEENLMLTHQAPLLHGGQIWTKERVFELFPRLFERRQHWGNQLSGGEQQMLTIARALLTQPRLLLIDEATEGLAPQIRAQLWQTLHTIAANGVALLIVDKNLNDLMRLAHRHLILVKGELVFHDDSAALTSRPDLITRWLGV